MYMMLEMKISHKSYNEETMHERIPWGLMGGCTWKKHNAHIGEKNIMHMGGFTLIVKKNNWFYCFLFIGLENMQVDCS